MKIHSDKFQVQYHNDADHHEQPYVLNDPSGYNVTHLYDNHASVGYPLNVQLMRVATHVLHYRNDKFLYTRRHHRPPHRCRC